MQRTPLRWRHVNVHIHVLKALGVGKLRSLQWANHAFPHHQNRRTAAKALHLGAHRFSHALADGINLSIGVRRLNSVGLTHVIQDVRLVKMALQERLARWVLVLVQVLTVVLSAGQLVLAVFSGTFIP